MQQALSIPTKMSAFALAMQDPSQPENAGFRRAVDSETHIRESLRSFCQQRGIAHVDTLPYLQRAVDEGRHICRNTLETHYNANGYAAVAQAAHDGLLELDLLSCVGASSH